MVERSVPARPDDPADVVDGLDARTRQELRALSEHVARTAGDLVRRMRTEAVDVARTKSTATDVVTRADLASEALVLEMLQAERPRDGVLGEEGASRSSASGLTWVIDPIDGTVNYLYGRADYAVSVAVVAGPADDVTRWRPVAGCVHAPASGRTWTAALGQGSTVDGQELRITADGDLAHALVGTGFSYDAAVRAQQGALVARVLPRVRDVRRAGAGALDVCAVASGELDAHYELGLNPWDVAAAVLVATEAGAEVRYGPADARGARVSVITRPALMPGLAALVELDDPQERG